MDLGQLKKTLLPLVSGTAVGALFAYFLLAPDPIPIPTPEIRIAIDSIQGMVISPTDLNGAAERVIVTAEIDGKSSTDTVLATEKSYHAFRWTSRLQNLQLDYFDEKGGHITSYSLNIGDGIIVDDLIIIGNSPIDSTQKREVQ